MSMVNFDENQIIANGAKIYDQRAKIEAIADSIVDNGFDLLLVYSSRSNPVSTIESAIASIFARWS